MKKFLFIVFAAVVATLACSKEADYSQDNNVVMTVDKDGRVKYSLTAYMEDITKASINPTDGKFSWSGGETIAVWDSHNEEFVTFNVDTYSNTGSKEARFITAAAKEGATFSNGNKAYYPALIAPTGIDDPYIIPTSFGSLDAASKGFPMQGTISGGKIKFTHLGSMIDVTLNNVPSFTEKLILSAGATDITVSATPTAGSIHAIVPIPAGTYVLTVKLQDDSENTFYSKSRTSKTYDARTYYPINPLTLGYLMTFTNNSGWTTPKIHIWKTEDSSKNGDITQSGSYPKKLFLRKTNKYYVLLDSGVFNWTGDGMNIGIQFISEDNGDNKTQTNCVALYRNIDFTIPSGGGMKTSYRIYVYMSDSQWASWKTQGSGTTVVKFTTWDGISTAATNATQQRNADNNGYIFFYEFSDTYYGTTNVKYRFYNEYNARWESKNESGVVINQDTWAKNL